MSRSFLLDAKIQHFVTEQYEKEARARIQFYHDTKSGKGYATKSYVIGLPDINPNQFAIKKKREEDEQMRRVIEEARSKQVKDEMWPVDARTRQKLYQGISRDGMGARSYLRDRYKLNPEDRFTFPVLSSLQYGWRVSDELGTYHKPSHGRSAKIEESFYSRNGVPVLSDPSQPGGVCHRSSLAN
jgi:hypothetical protein